jgi:hypothetical protein
MCMQMTGVRPYQKWHWAGDEIVHDAVIPAARRIPNTRRRTYPIDIRGFLSIESNAVLRNALHQMMGRLTAEDASRFFARQPGSFDFRAHAIQKFLSEEVTCIRSARGFDEWLFPEETLARGGGDCEDLAFLLAALLEQSGISRTCIRVALGRLIDQQTGEGGYHAWVVYQCEDGGWEILEPAILNRSGRAARDSRHKKLARVPVKGKPALGASAKRDIEYVPHFVFNRDHLWRIRSHEHRAAMDFKDYLGFRIDRFWTKFDPAFAVKAHEHIFDHALAGILSLEEISQVKHQSFVVDVNVLDYDPRDHFDFAYVPEGWQRVQERLASGSITDFSLAAHAIGDFYAHSFYAHCVPPAPDGLLALYDSAAPPDLSNVVYDFSNLPIPDCAQSAQAAADLWQGRLISGQWWRWYTAYPDELQTQAQMAPRRCLPDHDAVAVDSSTCPDTHRLYPSAQQYKRQYQLRLDAATRHVRQEAQAWASRR